MILALMILVALVIANGLFAGAEMAMVTVRKTRIDELATNGRRGAKAVQKLRAEPERFLATVQIGITMISATSAMFGGEVLARPLSEVLQRLGAGRYAEEIAFAAVVVLVSYLSLVLGELVPKSLALRYSEKYSVAVARPMLRLARVVRPLVWLLTASSNLVLRAFGDRTSFSESRLSREELRDLVNEATEAGSLDEHSSMIARRAIEFGSVTVGQLMVPRMDMVMVPRASSAEDLRRAVLEHGRSRMPVYDGSADHVIGYVIAKDLFALEWGGPLIILDDILRPLDSILESSPAVDALRGLQQRRSQLAIVVDAEQRVVGLVTVEDLVEEVVGEILTEHEPVPMVRQADGTIIVRGHVPIREINRDLGCDLLPNGDTWRTVGGMVAVKSGGIPHIGHILDLPSGLRVEVVEATSHRVVVVRLTLPSPPPSEPVPSS